MDLSDRFLETRAGPSEGVIENRRRDVLRVVCFLLAAMAVMPGVAEGDDWPPVPPADLALKDNPGSPGSHAMILDRSVLIDDPGFRGEFYYRIKVFTEEGKKYANIEIPYLKQFMNVRNVKARTIRPDGSITEFTGKVYDKLIVKARGVKIQAKALSLPDVQVGSVIEYKYTQTWDGVLLFLPFQVQHELYTRHATFSRNPYPGITLVWVNFWLPQGTEAKRDTKNGRIKLEAANIAAFPEESYMPPEDELKMRVEFYYWSRVKTETPDEFWKREGKEWHEAVEAFIGKRKGIERAAAELAPATDPAESKLRRFYVRAQQIRNLSYERDKTEKEEKREKLKDNNHVEDVLKHGYGYRNQINRLFIALARGAGLEAQAVRISERDTQFFHKQVLNSSQLDGEVALVKVGDKEMYLDPGTRFCPFGLLGWQKTGVVGIKLDKEGGAFIQTPVADSKDAVTLREGQLKLDEEGSLEGKLTITFTGLEAVRRRLEALESDPTGRQKELEDEVKEWLTATSTVKLEKEPNWEGTDEPLKAEFSVKVPEFAASTGKRLLLPLAVFQGRQGQVFSSTRRVHPVYFTYPYQEKDELTVELPSGLSVESLPKGEAAQRDFGSYQSVRTRDGKTLRLQRTFSIDGIIFRVNHYPVLRGFFEQVRTADETQAVLRAAGEQ